MSDKLVKTTETGLKDMIFRMYEHDFNESASEMVSSGCLSGDLTDARALSQDDRKFLEKMNDESRFVNGHYELPLPFRHQDVHMPNNRVQAMQRIQGIRRRFTRDQVYRENYITFMKELIDKGYARRVPIGSLNKDFDGRCWYLPHHGVYHPQKPGKIRIVFDCSCQHNGVSLNTELLQGPDLTNSLVGVLMRFRQEQVGFMADIESMFHQVKIPESQTDYLRFLWWTNGDSSAEPDDYQMQVHLFGAVSSPSCANYALRRTASDNTDIFGSALAGTLRRNFYVDDLLKSAENVEQAITMARGAQQMCAAGGFHLTKFASNDRRVIDAVPMEDRAKNIKNIDLLQAPLPIERALGVHWCIENDTIGFKIDLKDKPFTRRGILATISSIYDPLGLAAPFLMTGKRILQDLCSMKMEWGDEIRDDTRSLWERWRGGLTKLDGISVARCLKPPCFGRIVSSELHHFSDASQYGYGQCSYLRLTDSEGQVHCSLVMGKSRVSPLKPITIPRLELTAAVVSVKVGYLLNKELEYSGLTNTYWTDSKAVLGYVSNDVRRFHIFVANRVQLIRENSEVGSWRYVDTDSNPADGASRGISCSDISSEHVWFRGPRFLWESDGRWPRQPDVHPLKETDPNVRKQVIVCTTNAIQNSDETVLERIFTACSSWYKLKKNVAWILIMIEQLKQRSKKLPIRDVSVGLTVDELKYAEVRIIKCVQEQFFRVELAAIELQRDPRVAGSRRIPRTSPVHRLSPVLSSHGLMCVGGRLNRSALLPTQAHQIILPGSHHIASLIVDYYHNISGHSGREYVLSLIREKFWIIGARQLIRRVLRRCIRCRKCYAPPCEQKMSDLPIDRTTPDFPPFSFVGVDLFGPILVKVGRSDVKRYGCIFTCMASRAVHIEVVYSLEADSFINALQRFMCRRGQTLEIRSDNGTNFVGGDRELRQAVQVWNNSKIQEFMRQKEIVWKFNPPAASHMGGVWERQIRTIRKILSALVKQQRLNDESLFTLLCTVENIINSRPLTFVSDDPNDFEPLTPNHLLQLRAGSTVPPGVFVKEDLYCRRRWKQVQYLADLFWTRWVREYLPTLQQRGKWLQEQGNVQAGDVVLVVDDTLPRNNWLMGRVISVFPSTDGLVRTVKVQTKHSVLVRPVHKLCLIESLSDRN